MINDLPSQSRKKLFRSPLDLSCRSYSDENVLFKSSHRRTPSADLFSLVVPPINDSSLICSICSLPMNKPTLLPCQHTFCYQCLQQNEHVRSGSLPSSCAISTSLQSNESNALKTIICPKCSRSHQIRSVDDLEENQPLELLINTLLCEHCHNLTPSNQLDTCLKCYDVFCSRCFSSHMKTHENPSFYEEKEKLSNQSDENIFHPRSFDQEQKLNDQVNPMKINADDEQQINPKKKSSLKNWLNSPRNRTTTTMSTSLKETTTTTKKKTCVEKASSLKTRRRAKVSIEIQPETISTMLANESQSTTTTTSLPVPMTPVRQFLNLYDQFAVTEQHVKQSKKRQLELDRAVSKLVEIVTIKTNENLQQISQYWKHIKQMSLEQFQLKTIRFPLINSLFKSCCSINDSSRQFDSFIERNDELKAELQVLFSTLSIVQKDFTLDTLQQLFHREEQATLRSLRRNFDSLLWTYSDELTFITERIHVYEKRFANWKNSNPLDLESIVHEWTQIIEHDYPSLIEKISVDFISKLPQIEKNLLQMMKNMKKRLLNQDSHNSPRRTSLS